MPKIPLVAGFKDPVRRPRYIIWTGVAVLVIAAVMIPVIGATSTYWFCAEACHKVQDDTITAYNNSSHSEISCMACHMPVNADPLTFILHKAEALGELYLTVTDNFEIPLNGGSHLAMEMSSEQCTQCHSSNREVTASPGIIIDHVIHAENDVNCTMCHNRIAHNEEGIEFINVDPATGELNVGHPNYMKMTACFRCHSLEAEGEAPGECGACHPSGFELKPPSHFETDFYPAGHAEMALEDMEAVEAALAEGEHGEEGAEEGSEEATGTEGSEEGTEGESSMLGIESAYASEGGEEGAREWAEEIPTVNQVSYCSTCHLDSFCTNCHGMEMPHSEAFKTEEHPAVAAEKMDKCDLCHKVTETNFLFCNNCHHGEKSNWEYNPDIAWQTQHASTVTANGVDICLEACHEVQFCSDCHTELQPYPASHQAGDWLRKPAAEIGTHAELSAAQPTSCEVCHGGDLPNGNAFCKGCHVLEVPHPQDFKDFHANTGKENPAVCANCHTYAELCSDCHHEGAVDGTPWEQVHGGIVNDGGAASCFEKCHEQAFCVNCHTSRNVVPASHGQTGWTRRVALSTPAVHPAAYDGAQDSCTYCHGDGGPEAQFCMSCHVLAMPHAEDSGDEKFAHSEQIASGEYNRATCQNCHSGVFCDSCHHEYTGTERWVTYHDQPVRDNGAAGCLEQCHEELYCSNCHVNRAAELR